MSARRLELLVRQAETLQHDVAALAATLNALLLEQEVTDLADQGHGSGGTPDDAAGTYDESASLPGSPARPARRAGRAGGAPVPAYPTFDSLESSTKEEPHG